MENFRYPSDIRKLVLAGVSFTVEPGKQTALVGHAGCGKTTIFKLIQRLYDPTSGQILLDGHPLVNYDVHFLRSKIANVAQENVLFATSILRSVGVNATALLLLAQWCASPTSLSLTRPLP